jgi:hypothetical protein
MSNIYETGQKEIAENKLKEAQMGKVKELQILFEEGAHEMAKIKLANEDKQLKMYGETVAEMERMKPPFLSNIFYAFMILSDAQETMKFSRERARQYINKAKHFMAKELESKEGIITNDNPRGDTQEG